MVVRFGGKVDRMQSVLGGGARVDMHRAICSVLNKNMRACSPRHALNGKRRERKKRLAIKGGKRSRQGKIWSENGRRQLGLTSERRLKKKGRRSLAVL